MTWRDTFDALRKLPLDWDGEGSPPPSEATCQAAETFLQQAIGDLPKTQPFICPVSGGAIGVEWDCAGRHLELEFLSDVDVLWLYDDLQGTMDSGATTLPAGAELLREKIKALAAI